MTEFKTDFENGTVYNIHFSTNRSAFFKAVQEVCRLAVDNESKIPKEPDYEGDGYDDNGNLIYDTWICPTCFKKYELDYEKYSYCPNCGQRLDWSDNLEC